MYYSIIIIRDIVYNEINCIKKNEIICFISINIYKYYYIIGYNKKYNINIYV